MEYGLILLLISVVAIGAMGNVGDSVNDLYSTVSAAISGARP
jgi:Flp pilus assembly pilin Flp